MPSVREALRSELESRGHRVASDTFASRGEIYVIGVNDLASALFEFKPNAAEAMDTMYQGRWVEGLPPRFAVLPSEAAADAHFELLEQAGIIPLLYADDGDRVEFLDLDDVLGRYLRR
jgi:hypothetical protein